ncbi:helicase-related protein, partial [Enterococcus faecium]|uniref:helicase-related protein n=1 Tax=Enterococcus faecium TaxID=1352 RepID=UPI00293067A9
KGAHEQILQKFGAKEADILLGTQMIAKGLDFPEVTLVGVLNAKTKFLRTLASHYLTELLTSHQFHEEAISKDGERYRKYADNPI